MALGDHLNDYGELAYREEPYQATLGDLHDLFVQGAPFESRRRLVQRALELYAELVWAAAPQARLWINGGFTTLKQWGAPEDADVVSIVPVEDYSRFTKEPALLPLNTLGNARASSPEGFTAAKLHTMGGLIDGYFVADYEPWLLPWRIKWSTVNGPDKKPIDGRKKGFVEVRRT